MLIRDRVCLWFCNSDKTQCWYIVQPWKRYKIQSFDFQVKCIMWPSNAGNSPTCDLPNVDAVYQTHSNCLPAIVVRENKNYRFLLEKNGCTGWNSFGGKRTKNHNKIKLKKFVKTLGTVIKINPCYNAVPLIQEYKVVTPTIISTYCYYVYFIKLINIIRTW